MRFVGFWSELKAVYGVRDAAPVRNVYIGFADGGVMAPGVTSRTVLGLSSVWACLNVLSNGVSQLPWRERRSNLELPPSRLVQRPSALSTRREWVSFVVSVLALYDIAYLLKVGGTDAEGVPMGLLPLEPGVVMPSNSALNGFPVSPFVDYDEYMVGTQRVPRDQLEIIRRSPTPGSSDTAGGLLTLARISFAASIAAEGYASRYWQSGGSPNRTLTTDQHLNKLEAEDIRDRYAERQAKGPDYIPVLSGGMKLNEHGADPTTEAAVEARREQTADIARYFGVPTRMVNAPNGDSQTYASAESANQDFVRYTLSNYIGAIEDVISEQLPGGRRMKMDTEALTSGTQAAEAQAFQLATAGAAWMTPQEARDRWGLPPMEHPEELNPPAPQPAAAAIGANDNGQGI